MPISKTPPIEMFPVWSVEEQQPKVSRFMPLPDAAGMRKRMLFGIPLKSALTNEELEDDTIQHYIDGAISEIEHTLDLYITPVTFVEKHDYLRHQFTWNYNYLKLNHSNILSVERVELSFTNDVNVKGFVSFPLEHVHVMPQEGVIQLVPAFGTSLSGFLLSAFSGTQFHALRAIGLSNFPGGCRIKYTAGFEHDKVPAVLVELIETIAAIRTLSALGPLIFPHNSTSQSIDGTSQSVGTLGPAFLRQRMDELEKQKQNQLEAAKGYYQKRFLIDWI
jgi:hypothetical protein